LISYTYRLAFEGALGQRFGLASTIALFIFILIGLLTYINFKVFNKEEVSSP
jgi:ABC-type sugar transport system permease subunit